jgi:hypothetical protein
MESTLKAHILVRLNYVPDQSLKGSNVLFPGHKYLEEVINLPVDNFRQLRKFALPNLGNGAVAQVVRALDS